MSLEYDQYIREHRENVKKALEWMKEYLPIIDGIAMEDALSNADTHDESKFDKDEYDAYDAYFYGGNRTFDVVSDFETAWLKHIHKNPHHWQYWVLIRDEPNKIRPRTSEEAQKLNKDQVNAVDMPLVYIYEMIADWWSFSWKNGDLMEIYYWYSYHKDYMVMSARTRFIVEDILNAIEEILVKMLVLQRLPKPALMHSDTDDEQFYGVPELKKFPLSDKRHVKSAIRFFNYVDPEHEEELATAILKRAEDLGFDISKIAVSDENNFKKYLPKDEETNA